MANSDRSNNDFDTPWKDALTRYLPEFMAFYFPLAYAAIDWSKPHTFLDQELAQVVRDAELGKRLVDRLVEVATLTSGTQWVYIHIEVQGQPDKDFAERLFTYNYRLYDRYRRPVATLALLADEGLYWKLERFGYELFGCQVSIQFPTVKLLDYAPRLEELLSDPNPFALVMAAHLLTQQTRNDVQARYVAKWRLARLLYERDWDKQRIIDLFAVIDWLLRLPKDLEQ
jgi:Putative transposase, YhgA-like